MSGGVHQAQYCGFGDLDHDPGGVDPVPGESVPHAGQPVRCCQLDGRDVDADRAGQVRTLSEQRARLVQDLGADGGDETGVLGDVEEVSGAEQPSGGVRSAHECLVSDHVGALLAGMLSGVARCPFDVIGQKGKPLFQHRA